MLPTSPAPAVACGGELLNSTRRTVDRLSAAGALSGEQADLLLAGLVALSSQPAPGAGARSSSCRKARRRPSGVVEPPPALRLSPLPTSCRESDWTALPDEVFAGVVARVQSATGARVGQAPWWNARLACRDWARAFSEHFEVWDARGARAEGGEAGAAEQHSNPFSYARLVVRHFAAMAGVFPNLTTVQLPHWRELESRRLPSVLPQWAATEPLPTNAILDGLASLPSLTQLDWPQAGPINDPHIESLAKLTGLRCLRVNHGLTKGDNVDSSRACSVARLTALTALRELRLQTTDPHTHAIGFLTASRLAELSVLTQLTVLSCTVWDASDDDLARLGGLSNLRELDLFSMAGHEKEFEDALDLAVTDAGLMRLTGLTALEKLQLPPSANWTREGQAALLEALPALRATNAWYEAGVDADWTDDNSDGPGGSDDDWDDDSSDGDGVVGTDEEWADEEDDDDGSDWELGPDEFGGGD
mmetsp:Transcript_5162/g.13353  ORF Transcript_5162/g.13353 Transcript_5162/m.13353 type:complete len:476 (-) Transcript_5162:26-1453(-)